MRKSQLRLTYLLLLPGRYLLWWTIILWGYHQLSNQYFHTDMPY